jgi:DNA-3-methyladenine glycosylase I
MMAAAPGAVPGPDGLLRCPWALGSPDYLPYHDEEWGRPVRSDAGIFERLSLEAFQSGLSWLTILRKRPAFRAAFAGFAIDAVAAFGPADVERLLGDAGIVRNRAKIEATVALARIVLDFADKGGFARHLGSFVDGRSIDNARTSFKDVPAETDVSRAIAKDLRARGGNFVGPTIIYAFMQATGMVNDHLVDCCRHEACRALARELKS